MGDLLKPKMPFTKLDQNTYRNRLLERALKEISYDKNKLPRKGWIYETRFILQMTAKKLALKMGIAEGLINHYEQAERNKTISLGTLEEVADALGCELRYWFVPKSKEQFRLETLFLNRNLTNKEK